MYMRVPRPFNRESNNPFNNGTGKTGYSQVKSWTLT